MRRRALKLLFLGLVTIGLFVGSMHPWDFSGNPARAQDAPQSAATPAGSATAPLPTDTPASSATATPVPTATIAPPPTDSDTVTANTATATVTSTATVMPTTTATPVAPLPPLTDAPDAPGTVATATIDSAGGRLSSADGRVTIDFPNDATSAPLSVSITRHAPTDATSPSPDRPVVGFWSFDATSTATGAAVHLFATNLTITIRFRPDDLTGMDARNLAFWTYDEPTQKWVHVPATVTAETQAMTVSINHFSNDMATASRLIDLATLGDGANVSPQSGAATFAVPIDVPAGRAGLTPDLTLTYDSGRVSDMHHYSDIAGWAGLGWDLTAPSVSVDRVQGRYTLNLAGYSGEMIDYDRYDGSMGTDSIFPLGSAGYHVYHLRDNPYVDIRSDCYVSFYQPCTWEVIDTTGRTYVFGGDAEHDRYQMVYTSAGWDTAYYQFDLKSVADLLGNHIDYQYWRPTMLPVDASCFAALGSDDACRYVMSAYPKEIDYNYDGGGTATSKIVFNPDGWGSNIGPGKNTCDFDPGSPDVCERTDTPYDVGGGQNAYYAPKVLETQRLVAIGVYNNGELVRRYQLDHSTTSVYYNESGSPWTPYVGYWQGGPVQSPSNASYVGGVDELTGVDVMGADGSSTLQHLSFDSTPALSGYWNTTIQDFYNWQYLTHIDNGLGGNIDFTYAEHDPGGSSDRYTREAVSTETNDPGFGQTPVVTSYDYAGGPAELDYPNPFVQPYPGYPTTGYDPQNSVFRGYGTVTVTDGPLGQANNKTIHSYYTTGNICCDANGQETQSAWQNEILTGREYHTVREDANGTVWQDVATTWGTRAIPMNTPRFPNDPDQSLVNFISPTTVVTTLSDATSTYEQHAFDQWGNETATTDFVGTTGTPATLTACSAANQCVKQTNSAFQYVSKSGLYTTEATFFRPSFKGMTDPQSGALMSCERYYYDGATSAGTLATDGSAKGLLTATSKAVSQSTSQCDATTAYPLDTASGVGSTNTYTAYDQYGNSVASSVPTSLTPESQPTHEVLPSYLNATYGWVPSKATYNVAYATTVYDSNASRLPATQTNAAGQPMSTSYNVLFDKPGQVTQANGDIVTYQYDTFGRLTDYWDGLDAANCPGVNCLPTEHIQYTWGSLPNQTLVQTRVASGGSDVHTAVTCADGFGREVDRRESTSASNFNEVRTDYDARGQKLVETQAKAAASAACPTTLPDTTYFNRTTYTYDPLGNVANTTSVPSGTPSYPPPACAQPGGTLPCTMSTVSGQTTTLVDQDRHETITSVLDAYTFDPLGRTKVIVQETGTGPYEPYASTWYRYDASGQLIQVNDATADVQGDGGNQTTMTYDLAGHKTGMIDPDMGSWTYVYDAAGNLVKQTDNLGITTTMTYDALNRLLTKTYSNGDHTVTYTYDSYATLPAGWCNQAADTAAGQQVEMDDGAGSEVRCFDVRGEAVKTRRTVDGVNYDTDTSYDDLGQVSTLTYPADSGGTRETVQYTPGGAGDVTGLQSSTFGNQDIYSNAQLTPFGALQQLTLGNGAVVTDGYDSSGRIDELQVVSGSWQFHTQLGYDAANNVRTTADLVSGETITYGYDDLNRLTSATGYADGSSASYSYDVIGDLTHKQEGSADLTLCYPSGQPRPHAVTTEYAAPATCGTGTPLSTFGYQGDGSMIASGDQGSSQRGGHAFDAENRLTEVLSAPANPSGAGFSCVDVNGDGSITSVDTSAVQALSGKAVGQPGFNYLADVTQDGTIAGGVTTDSDYRRDIIVLGQPCPTTRDVYTYDGNGKLLKREHLVQSPGGWTTQSWTVYIGGVYEMHSDGSVTKYYNGAGRTVAIRQVGQSGGAGSLSFPVTDHLGSTRALLDQNGGVAKAPRPTGRTAQCARARPARWRAVRRPPAPTSCTPASGWSPAMPR